MELFPDYQIPGLRQSFAILGLNYFQQEQFNRAVEFFSKARDQNDVSGFTDNDLNYLLVRGSLAQGNFEKADKYETILRKAEIPACLFAFLRAERKFLEGNVAAAIPLYESVLPLVDSRMLEDIITLAGERLQFLRYEKPGPKAATEEYERIDPVYRSYARVISAWRMSEAGVDKTKFEPLIDGNKTPDAHLLKVRLWLQAGEYEKTMDLLAPDPLAPGLRSEFELLRIRCAIVRLEDFEKCRAELDQFVRENGEEKLMQPVNVLSDKNVDPDTSFFVLFCRLALGQPPALRELQQLEAALGEGIKRKTAAYPEKFVLRLKGELLELEGKDGEAAAAYLESAKNYYWEGTEKYGQVLYEKCLRLRPDLMECYWYYADAAYLNSFTEDSPNNGVPEKLEQALKIWNAGLQRESPTAEFAWAYITGARIYKNRGYRQLNSEKLYRALIFSEAALLLEPGKAAWQPSCAGYFNDLGLNLNAFAITCPSPEDNRTDIGFREEYARSVIEVGDFETAMVVIKELIELNQAGRPYYDSWQAFIYFHQGDYPASIDLLKRVVSSKENENDLWVHDLLMLIYWITGDEKGTHEMSAWIISIGNNENYPFRENELALAAFIEGDYTAAWELIEPCISNETFETSASTLGLLCLLQQNRLEDAGALIDRLLRRPLSYPEANEFLIMLGHIGNHAGFRNWANYPAIESFLSGSKSIERVREKIAGISRKSSAKPESLVEELEWELKNNKECQENSAGYVAIKFSMARLFLSQDKWREALALFKELLIQKALFPLRLREVMFAVGARINSNEEYWEYIDALKGLGTDPDEKEERLIRSAANQYLVTYLGLSNEVESPVAESPVSVELERSLVPDEVMADFKKADAWALFSEYIPKAREQFLENCGIDLPPFRFKNQEVFETGMYLIFYYGVPMYSWKVHPGHCYCFDISPEEIGSLGIGADEVIAEKIPLEKEAGTWIPLLYSKRLTGKRVLQPLQVMMLHIYHLMESDIGLFINAQKTDELLTGWRKDEVAGRMIDELFLEDGLRKRIKFGKVVKRLARDRVPLNDYMAILRCLTKSGLRGDDIMPEVLQIRSELSALLRKSDEQRKQTLVLDEAMEQLSLSWIKRNVENEGNTATGRGMVTTILTPPDEFQRWMDDFRRFIQYAMNDLKYKGIPPMDENLVLLVKDPLARWVVHDLIRAEFPGIIVLQEQESKRWAASVAPASLEAIH